MFEKTASLRETVMDEKAMNRTLQRMTHEILEANPDTSKLQVIGVLRRGGDLAKRLVKCLSETEGTAPKLGFLDIGFYRDDAFQNVTPVVHQTDIPFSINGSSIVLVDDVLFPAEQCAPPSTHSPTLDAQPTCNLPSSLTAATASCPFKPTTWARKFSPEKTRTFAST